MTETTVDVPTAPITIYGASDDLVEIEGQVRDEFDLNREGPSRIRLTDPATGDSLDVFLRFGVPGSRLEWNIAVAAVNTYPDWSVRFHERPDREGDPAVTIEAPLGTTVTDVS